MLKNPTFTHTNPGVKCRSATIFYELALYWAGIGGKAQCAKLQKRELCVKELPHHPNSFKHDRK